ncbi:MAG TPA: hypothetical protein VN461_03630 [Vicinamibacteria bacterium]|jgi:hypothetical protein|nr:hypothetical protein [Vicinamibacteria bacterium]
MDDERIRQLAEEVLLDVRGAVPGPGDAPSLEARVAALEAAVREGGAGRAAVVVALVHPSHSLLGVSAGGDRCVMEPDKPCVQSGMCRTLGH